MTTRKKTTRARKEPDLQQKVQKSAKKIWLAGLGAFALAEEEGGKLFKKLVAKGEDYEEMGKEQLERAREQVEKFAGVARDKAVEMADDVADRTGSAWNKLYDNVDDKVSTVFQKVGVPTRNEIQRLTRRIEDLTKLVEKKAARGGKAAAGRGGAQRRTTHARTH